MTAAAIITAGGRGVRFGSGAPKQFAVLGGKPLLAHSVETFSSLDIISEIVLVAPDDWVPYVEKEIAGIPGSRVSRVVPGGAERQHSVENGFNALSGEPDVVVVHDGVVYFGMGTPSRTFVRGIPRDGPLEGPEDAFTPYAILGAYGTQLPLATLGEDVLVVDRSTNEVLTLANEPGIDPTSRYVHDRGIRGLADVAGTLFLVDSVLQNSWYVHRGFRVTSASSLVYDESELDRLVGDSADVYVAGDIDVAPSLTTRLYSLGANAEAAGAPTAVTAGLRRVTDMALDASHVFVVDDEISHEVRLVSVSRVSR